MMTGNIFLLVCSAVYSAAALYVGYTQPGNNGESTDSNLDIAWATMMTLALFASLMFTWFCVRFPLVSVYFALVQAVACLGTGIFYIATPIVGSKNFGYIARSFALLFAILFGAFAWCRQFGYLGLQSVDVLQAKNKES